MKLRVLEATGLKPPATTAYWGVKSTVIDPYVLFNVDEVQIAQTTSKQRTFNPVWNEEFESEVENGQFLGITVFHNSLVPPKPFVANSTVSLEEIINSGSSDIWVGISYPCFQFTSAQWGYLTRKSYCRFPWNQMGRFMSSSNSNPLVSVPVFQDFKSVILCREYKSLSCSIHRVTSIFVWRIGFSWEWNC